VKKIDEPLETRAKAVATALAQKILGDEKFDPQTGGTDLGRHLLIKGLAKWLSGLGGRGILGDLEARGLVG